VLDAAGQRCGRPLGSGLPTDKYRRSTNGQLSDLKTLVHTESSEHKTAVINTVLAGAQQIATTSAQVSNRVAQPTCLPGNDLLPSPWTAS
jgi:hypothetical protein